MTLVLLSGVVLSQLAGCKRSNDESPPSAATQHPSGSKSAEPSVSTGSATAGPGTGGHLLPTKPPRPPGTPEVPPQVVACGKRHFYRITNKALQVFQTAEQLPPPNIRGSRVSQQTGQVDVAQPLNVISLAGDGLVLARQGVFLHHLGDTQAARYASVDVSENAWAWPDPRDKRSFWVRKSGSNSLQQYALSPAPTPNKAPTTPSPGTTAAGANNSRPSTTEPLPITNGATTELAEFDSRLFTILNDTAPVYSTAAGLRKADSNAKASFPALPGEVDALFADAQPSRYWTADGNGGLSLWAPKQDAPMFTFSVPGAVVDSDALDSRVAILSIALKSLRYQPSVTVFEGKKHYQIQVGPSLALSEQPGLDLCLMPDRPWVVVGGRDWLQLLDYTGPRLLAEW